MPVLHKSRFVAVALLILVWGWSSVALELPAVLGDHMVLQRGMPVPIWGQAEPGQAVTVEFAGETVEAVTDAEGNWRVNLPSMEASAEPRVLTVALSDGTGEPRVLSNVLVGEVWHASGQSNMQWPINRSKDPEQEAAAATDDRIRVFMHPREGSATVKFTAGGRWQVTSPETAPGFPAVAFYFARELRAELGVPVGIVSTPWGGASAEAFVSDATLRTHEGSLKYVKAYERELAELEKKIAAGQAINAASLPERHSDPGNVGFDEGLAGVELDDSAWTAIPAPGLWETSSLGQIDGVVWLRKRVTLPKALQGKALVLSAGTIDDADVVYVQGVEVGSTPIGPESWKTRRRYDVPAELTGVEELTIAVRVFDHFGGGGIAGIKSEFFLADAGDVKTQVTLAGTWQALVRHPMDPKDLRGAHEVKERPHRHRPAYLYRGMIHPVAPYAIRGAIWYQGESNSGRHGYYDPLMRRLIDDWRALWDQPGEHREFPFLAVQLAHWRDPVEIPPQQDNWASLRAAQHQTAMEHDHSHLATAVDIGEANDIHPKNKQEVGRRLSLIALNRVYGFTETVDQGPTFDAMHVASENPGELTVSFTHAEGLSTTDGQAPRGVAVQTKDGLWEWANETRIADGKLVVLLPEGLAIAQPPRLRYGWAINPTDGPNGINLVNAAGLPAFPFDTAGFTSPE